MSANQSVSRALAILEHLALVIDPQDLGAISRALQLNKSTVHRFLSTLKEGGYVRQEPESGKYALGSRLAWLGSQYLDSLEIRRAARPILEGLASESGETVHLGVLDGFEVTYVDKVDGRGAVRMASRIGGRMPVHCTALGKVLLSSLPREEWKRHLETNGLPARTSRTITNAHDFVKELDKIASQGHAVDNGENEEGIRCIAAPILDHARQTVAALSATGWTVTMTDERIDELIPKVMEAGVEVSLRLGYVHSDEARRVTE